MLATKIICDIFISVFEFLILYIYYSIFGDKNDNMKKLILFSSTGIITNTLAIYFVDIYIIYILINIAVFFIYSYLYKIPILRRVLVVFSIYIVSLLFEILIFSIMSLMYQVSISYIHNNVALFIQTILLSKLLIFTIIKNYSIIRKWEGENNKRIILAISSVPVFTFFVIFTLSAFIYDDQNSSTQIMTIFSTIILISSNIFVFDLLDHITAQAHIESRHEFYEKILENETEYYKSLIDYEYISNKTIHDLKNQLFAIRSIYEKNTSEAYDEINKICEKIDSNKVVVISSNDAVNSLVNSKVNIAKDKGINVEIESFISDINNINLVDFCMIIGNLFDNAIEACDKVLDDKKIYLELKSMNQYISITMKNTTINENVIIGKTSKKDLKKHGFGLSNINEVIKDYNGNMRYEIVDNYFTINIILEKGN